MEAGEWWIVEGLGDLLALVDGAVAQRHLAKEYGYVILNSTSHASRAVEYLVNKKTQVINVMLDIATGNDNGADYATSVLLEAFPGVAQDLRHLIRRGKDIRDCWNALRS